MKLEERIKTDILESMKSKNARKLETLRMVKAAITNIQIEKKKDLLDDSEVIAVVQKQVKQRKESVESYKTGNRPELAAKEQEEIEILEAYLPKQLSENEIAVIAKEVIKECGAQGAADSGKVMKGIMPKVQGRADGKLVSKVVKDLLKIC